MFTIDRIHFGFSDWTIVSSIYLVLGQIVLISYFNLSSKGVNGQRNFKQNVSPSSPSTVSTAFQPPTKCPYTSEDILGVIVTSVIVTIVVIGLTLVLFWYLWKKKIITLPGSTYLIRDVDLNDKTIQVDVNNRVQANGTHLLNDEDKQYKRLIKSLPPLTSVFNHISHQSKGPIKSLDDTFIMTKPEQVRVQLTGHDFTGLGFNIVGNMRDGIFIKDVLTRGPANESGLIKAGDRIVSITVSFEKMVYEDALTILSYASPYDVTLQVEKTSKSKATTPNLNGKGHIYTTRRLANGYGSNDPSNHRILHPVFRSHSVGELTTRLNTEDKPSSLEGKSFGSIKSINSLLKKIKTSLYRSTESIKPNQLDKGKTSDYCSNNGLHEVSSDYHHSCYSLDASGLINRQISANSSYILPSSTHNINVKSTLGEIAINMNPAEQMKTPIKHLSSSAPEDAINNLSNSTMDTQIEKPEINESTDISPESPSQSGPAKKIIQGKRKAPAPPSPSSSTCSIEMKQDEIEAINVTDGLLTVKDPKNERSASPGGSQVETHAVIHHEQESSEYDAVCLDHSLSDISELKSPAIDISLSLAMESLTSDELTTEPHPVNLIKEMNGDVKAGRAQSPAGKSKSCSLSDLTLVKNKKPASTIILERAVSLDLKDQLAPEENMILHQGTGLEDNQGLLRWSGPKPTVCGPDSLSTTYSSEILGSSSKTNDFTDNSLTITIDEISQPIEKFAPKPAERTSLKKNSLSDSTDSKLHSSCKLEAVDMIISEEDNIVAPPDGFGSDNNQCETIIVPKPSIENVKLKTTQSSEHDKNLSDIIKDQTDEIAEDLKSNDRDDRNDHSSVDLSKIPTPKKQLFERFELLSSPDRLDSTLFDLADSMKIISSDEDCTQDEKFRSLMEIIPNGIPTEPNLTDSDKNTYGSNLKITSNPKYSEPEIIEISPIELSQVMMSHEEFLARKTKFSNGKLANVQSHLIHKSGIINNCSPSRIGSKVTPSTIIQIGEAGEEDFESWSYLSDVDGNLPSLSNETRYKTTCDMNPLNDDPSGLVDKNVKGKDTNC